MINKKLAAKQLKKKKVVLLGVTLEAYCLKMASKLATWFTDVAESTETVESQKKFFITIFFCSSASPSNTLFLLLKYSESLW